MKRSSWAPRILSLGAALVATVLLAAPSTPALAHGGTGITITPATAMPGDTVAVTAAAVSTPGGDITITLLGNGVNSVLPMQKASPDGDFEGKVTLPTNLVPGAYQLQVKGDKAALTGDIDISGTAAAAPAPVIQPRERPLSEMLLLVGVFGVLAGVGLLFALTANRRARAALR